MRSDDRKDLAVGFFFIVLSLAYMVGARTISTFTPFGNRGLDSRSIPLLIGFLTFVLAVLHVVLLLVKERKLRARNAGHATTADDSAPDAMAASDRSSSARGAFIARIDDVVPVKLILSMSFLVIYVAAYQPAGFILSSTFFLTAESFLLVRADHRKKNSIFIILFSVLSSVLIYFIFTRYLSLFLPRGILG